MSRLLQQVLYLKQVCQLWQPAAGNCSSLLMPTLALAAPQDCLLSTCNCSRMGNSHCSACAQSCGTHDSVHVQRSTSRSTERDQHYQQNSPKIMMSTTRLRPLKVLADAMLSCTCKSHELHVYTYTHVNSGRKSHSEGRSLAK